MATILGSGQRISPSLRLHVPQPPRRVAEALEVGRARLVGEREEEIAHRLAGQPHGVRLWGLGSITYKHHARYFHGAANGIRLWRLG
jgi:hypothetical protein